MGVEKDRGTARECFGRGQRGSRGSQGLPRDDITSGRGVRPRPRATSDKRYRGYIGERDNVSPIAGGQPLAGVVKSEPEIGLDGTGHNSHKIVTKQRSPRASGNEPPRARLHQPSPGAGASDEWPSEARGGRSPTVGSPHSEGLASSGVQLAPDDKGGLAGPSGELRRENHGDGSPSTVQAWFRQLGTLGLSALLKDAGRELFNRDIIRWREVADVANELLDRETLPARSRLVNQMATCEEETNEHRSRTERSEDLVLVTHDAKSQEGPTSDKRYYVNSLGGPGFLTARIAPPPLSPGCGLLRGARTISASTRGA